jgi:AraC-like DNA-binding protein
MMELITEEEYLEQRQESLKYSEVIYNTQGFDRIEKCHSELSIDDYRIAQLQPELWLIVDNEKFYKQLNKKSDHYGFYSLVSKFYLTGYHSVVSPGIEGVEANYVETAGKNYLFYLPDIKEIEQSFAGDRIHVIKIEVELDFLRTFSTGWEFLPQQLQPLMESHTAPLFHRPVGNITPAMQVALQQILHAPYQGTIQRMYLESKVLELLALQFAQLIETERGKQSTTKLKPIDIDRIYQAKEILIQHYDCPPLLIDLAKQVGINDCKLKQGFRQVFGNTVFGYLHDYRMDVARQLLQEGKMSVTAVANAIGYAGQGHFAAAFKRKFGITPKACRLGEKFLRQNPSRYQNSPPTI